MHAAKNAQSATHGMPFGQLAPRSFNKCTHQAKQQPATGQNCNQPASQPIATTETDVASNSLLHGETSKS
jgi:hypothetical protein